MKVKRRSGGRASIRTVLYMGMMSAIQHNAIIRDMFQRLVAKDKHKKVALTACMRKMITILNAMVRDNQEWSMVEIILLEVDLGAQSLVMFQGLCYCVYITIINTHVDQYENQHSNRRQADGRCT